MKEIKTVMAEAEAFMNLESRRTIMFVDEIHRFNKAQQDAFLPYVENGAMIDVNKAIELMPDLAEAFDTRGTIYLARKKYDLALTDFNASIER